MQNDTLVNVFTVVLMALAVSGIIWTVHWFIRRHFIAKYGEPEFPDDVENIISNFRSKNAMIKISDYNLIVEDGDWRLWEKRITENAGMWNIQIEMRCSNFVAYHVVFKSNKTGWLNIDVSDSFGKTRFLNSSI